LKKGVLSWFDLIMGSTRKSLDFTDCKYYNPFELISGDEHYVWDKLKENQGVIEFIDVEESNTCMVAMEFNNLHDRLKKFTHCEIHPSTIFAVLTANIPFADHNQAPRNYFSGAQGKQAIGMYNTAFNSRMDTMSVVLHYPHKRLVNTRYMHYIGNNDMSQGHNAIVAIMTYTGLTLC
jgi:DNA-directed RNA polymerase beta subunit